MTILDGNKVANQILDDIKKQVTEYENKFQNLPKLATILIGDDPASKTYVNNKLTTCKKVGILSKDIYLPKDVEQLKLIKIIHELNQDQSINGILLQLPLPKGISTNRVLTEIDPIKDVDGLSPLSFGKLCHNKPLLNVCTALGIQRLLEHYELGDFASKNITIVGSSIIVGKPLALMFINMGATVTVCNILTKNLQQNIQNADILVSAIGKKNIIQSSWLKPGVIAIDVGINHDENNRISGDLDFDSAKNIASSITPVPGGVGPMTIAILMENVLYAAKMQRINK